MLISYLQSLRIVDSKTFRGLLKFQRPKTRESEIPHRTKLTEFLVEKAQLVSVKLREIFKVMPDPKCHTSGLCLLMCTVLEYPGRDLVHI